MAHICIPLWQWLRHDPRLDSEVNMERGLPYHVGKKITHRLGRILEPVCPKTCLEGLGHTQQRKCWLRKHLVDIFL